MSPKSVRYLLEVRGGDQAPAELPRSGMMVIGSSPEKAGFCIDGQGVAEVHCAIGKTKDGGFAIKDLGSEFGTHVNGARVSQARLNEGDDILVGSMRLRIVTADGSPTDTTTATAPKRAAKPKAKAKPKTKPSPKPAKTPTPKIPGYRVHQILGRGAMGSVYLAVQESLDREVALKVLSKEHEQDSAFVESFQAEARSAAALNHPNVVTVHDVGEADGVHYLTMEYMDRSSLEERVAKEGALPWPIVLGNLKDAASGLVYAESRGIVHRDIKPANLMQNHTGVTKIADLGLATSISQEEAPDGERKLFGTPHFISPEQIKGEKADCRSDLYSLGSTAYRLLTGRTPYEGANTREILRAKLRGQPTPMRELATDVPEDLERIVARLMAIDPAERYPSASALLREIEALQSGGGQGSPSAPAAKEGGKLLKLGIPIGVVLLLVIAAATMMGGGSDKGGSNASSNSGPAPPINDPSPFTEIPESPEDLPALGDVGESAPDNDIQEKLFETAAENALLKLGQRDLSPAERRDALRELAREYLGTTAASTAIEEAKTIDAQLTLASEKAEARDTRLGAMMKALGDVAGLTDPALRPGNSLRAMGAVEGQAEMEIDDAFKAERSKLEDLVISTALEQFAVVEQQIQGLMESGDFETVETTATDLLGRCDLPAFEEGRTPARSEEIGATAERMRTLLADIENLEIKYLERISLADRQSLASGIAGSKGIADDIGRLDFQGALERSASISDSLRSDAAKAWGAGLTSQLELASKAIPILIADFSDWRRLKIEDPEDDRGRTRDVNSASAKGLVLDERGEARDVPWSSFGGNTKALDTLFSKRLNRDYSEEENRSIGALMHFSAVSESLQQASEMFTTNGGAIFTKGEAEELTQAYDLAQEWLPSGPEREALEVDRRAATLLGDALLSGTQDQWTTAVSQLEQLLLEYPDSLLVRLLSDGSAVELPR